MPVNTSFKSLWHSLNFTARLAALTTLLVLLSIPLTVANSQSPTRTQSSAQAPSVIPQPLPSPPTPLPTPTCRPRPLCLDTKPRCLIAKPAEGWCPGPIPSVKPTSTPRSLGKVGPTPAVITPLPTPRSVTPPLIRTGYLPEAKQSQPYSATIFGQETTTTTLALSAQNLPLGLSLGACQPTVVNGITTLSCTLTGIVRDAAGTYPLNLRLTDSSGNTAVKTLNLVVTGSSFWHRLFPN